MIVTSDPDLRSVRQDSSKIRKSVVAHLDDISARVEVPDSIFANVAREDEGVISPVSVDIFVGRTGSNRIIAHGAIDKMGGASVAPLIGCL